MFLKSSVGYGLSNCLDAKKCIWNAKYTIRHRIEGSQTTECIQYTYTIQCRVNCPNISISYNSLKL